MIIATKHQKEKVIAPICEANLGVKCIVPDNLDTDQLGTFSGEIERKLSPVESARQKCLMAMELTGADLAISNEGSFGAHPGFFLSSADDEIVMLVDQKNNIEILGRKLSAETNFGGEEASSLSEAKRIAAEFKFNSHGLILRYRKNDPEILYKGITSRTDFEKGVENILDSNGKVWIETDMRALYNPSRMAVIEQATINLIDKAKSLCPSCHCPGFSIRKVIPGLPCFACDFPTKSTLAHLYECQKCHYINRKEHPNNKFTESPQFCDYCNP